MTVGDETSGAEENGVRQQTPELHDLIDTKIEALIEDAHAGGWSTDDALMAIEQVVARRWLRHRDAVRVASAALNQNFVSDGNEG